MTTRRDFHRSVLGLGAAALVAPFAARADDGAYPTRPVRIIVPFAAGGGPDVLTRKLAVKLAEALGHGNVIVENMVGAGGIVAGQNVVRMAPDGYNLLLGASSFVVQKLMEPGVKFDPVKDFTHITRTSYSSSVLVVRADSPYKTIEDLVAAARREPGKLNYASGGVGSAAHLCGAALALTAKIDVVHVPYKGSVEIVPSILQGATQYAVPIASTAIPQIRAGKVRALAVTSVERMKALPDVPTLVETFKAPELALDAWFGLWAPAGLPKPLVDTLFAATGKAYADPALRADTESVGGLVALSQSPAEFTQFIEAETVKFRTLVKAAHLVA
jgi:tripartite-type tricarboxylate transporter receptor subunit TctC